MRKTIFRPFWSFNVVKTEKWLSAMHAKGYSLRKINFALRVFVFEKTEPMQTVYHIVFEKHVNGVPEIYLEDSTYEKVCFSNNFFVLRTEQIEPVMIPSYTGFLKRNKRVGTVIGYLLLFSGIFSLPGIMIFSLIASLSSFSFIDVMVFSLSILSTIPAVCIFFMLRKTNRELEKLCGDTLDLSFTVPKETIISKSERIQLCKSGKMFKRTRLAWQYAPDKVEIWLEQIAQAGYHLVMLSKLGISFYFLKGEPYKAKYHIDYQNKTDPSYYDLNKDVGWKLYFTSISRVQNLSIWGQAYTNEPPMFYSDSESQIKHARNFALSYSLCFIPVVLLYISMFVRKMSRLSYINWPDMILENLIFFILIFEFGFFATRTILYYLRVKKAAKD